jgi:hypothetical protein
MRKSAHEWGTRNPTHDDKAVMNGAPEKQKQIPFGNDKQKGLRQN